MIPRSKIRAFISNNDGIENPSAGIEAARTLSKAYSGFVHGASPQIMETFGGDPPRFHTKGMLGTPRVQEGLDDLWNYMYRSFLSYILVLKILGKGKCVDFLTKKKAEFERRLGKQY